MKYLLLFLLSIVVLFSCTKEDPDNPVIPDNPEEQVGNDKMDLENLEVGQKFYYILLTGESYFSDEEYDFTYMGDTLELEVVSENDGKYIISEKITPLSNMKLNNVNYYWNQKDSIYFNQWQIRNDSLIVESFDSRLASHLLNNGNLPLDNFESEEVKIKGWKTEHPYIEANVELFAVNYTLLSNSYDHLNVLINNILMQVDGPGNTTIYSLKNGIVRTSTYSWWTQSGYGWDKL